MYRKFPAVAVLTVNVVDVCIVVVMPNDASRQLRLLNVALTCAVVATMLFTPAVMAAVKTKLLPALVMVLVA